MSQRIPSGSARLHPTRHLLYAFLVGAVITCTGFGLAWLDASPAPRAATTLVIAGSETLQSLMSTCAETYSADHPDVDVIVRGGGSAAGIASLLAGQVDLALSSRELTSEELNATPVSRELQAVPIAREGIALIAHHSVSVPSMDLEQLAAVLAGEISDWSAVGPGKGKILLVGRAAGSGTAAVVQEQVLGRRAMAADAQLRETHEAVILAVGTTPGAVGYADAHLARLHKAGVQIIPVRHDADDEAHLPGRNEVETGKYPLARTLYIVTLQPSSAPIQGLIEHCTGQAGSPAVEAAGFLPVSSRAHTTSTDGDSSGAEHNRPHLALREHEIAWMERNRTAGVCLNRQG